METDYLKIPKQLSEVTMWVHSEGRVHASLYLSFQGETMRPEEPLELLNQGDEFLAVKRDDPEEVLFYHKSAIVRIEYQEESTAGEQGEPAIECTLSLMDGAVIKGTIRRFMPPEKARLYDYINLKDEPFIKLHLDENSVCLINKAYIVRAAPTAEAQ